MEKIQTLVLIRGLPGSRKSTFASKMIGFTHLAADMFFLDAEGNYSYDPALVRQAHEWCQHETKASLSRGESVVVSNTFVSLWEMEPYLTLADDFGVSLDVVEARNLVASITIPAEKIEAMRNMWEPMPMRTISSPLNC